MDAMTPTDTMQRHYDTWNARDFDGFEAQLADDMTFAAPLGTANGPAECRRGIEGLSEVVDRVDVLAMAPGGSPGLTSGELHAGDAGAVPVANWATVEDGTIRRVRVTF